MSDTYAGITEPSPPRAVPHSPVGEPGLVPMAEARGSREQAEAPKTSWDLGLKLPHITSATLD